MGQGYKLIKKFPFANSPEIGYISKFEYLGGVNDKEHYWNGNDFNPADYPEFWEKVLEKDYEILSLKSIRSTIVIDYKNGGGSYTKGRFEAFYKSKDKWIKSFLTSEIWMIYSVKRLSDGEIFTIGDKVRLDHNKKSIMKIITKIDLENIGVCPENLYIHTNGDQSTINNYVKASEPLFTTEDGVDIFEINTKVWYVDNDFKLPLDKTDADIAATSKSEFVFFSTKEKAEEYVLLNKPCLSLNDIEFAIFKTNNAEEKRNKLKDLVKSKLYK